MWDIIAQAALAFVVGAAVGYGVAAIIEALSRTFAQLWANLVETVQTIWGYITEATKHYLAVTAQYLDNNWAEIENYLQQQLGYTRDWLFGIFQENSEAFIGFINPYYSQEESMIFSLGIVEDQNVQLPSMQNPIVTELVLT